MGKLKGDLSLLDAVNIALGSIIGAGIFVIIGSAAGQAGPAIVLSIIIAAAVAAMTGFSTAELSKRYPKSGGAYTFAKETISDDAGFIVGWVWLFSNIATGATVALGFGHYLAFFLPSIPIGLAAAGLVLAVTAVNLLGAKQSSTINNILVLIKLSVLIFFVLSAAQYFKTKNFEPFMPFGINGVLAGAATIFFAYSGFARVAVMADEIHEPKKNVPRATMISIGASTLIYALVAVSAVGLAGYAALSESGSPLSDAMNANGMGFGATLVGVGALVATSTVALASILGLSRIAHTMSSNGDLPALLAKTDKSGAVPTIAVILSGTAMLAFVFLTDLPNIAFISSFSLLLYYAAINLSGMKSLDGSGKAASALGLIACIILMVSLPILSWLVGAAVILVGFAYYIFSARGKKAMQ